MLLVVEHRSKIILNHQIIQINVKSKDEILRKHLRKETVKGFSFYVKHL